MNKNFWSEHATVRPWGEVVRMLEEKTGIRIGKSAARSLHHNALRKMRKVLEGDKKGRAT